MIVALHGNTLTGEVHQLSVKHRIGRVQYLKIESVESVLATDIVLGHLSHAHGLDIHDEIFPLHKGEMQ